MLKNILARILLFVMIFGMLPFGLNNNITYAVDADGTADLDMTLSPSVAGSSIIGSNFSYNFTIKNETTSEGAAFKNGFILSIPDKISYVNNSGLGVPVRTLVHSSGNTLYFFETNDFLSEGSSSNYSITLKSDNDALLLTDTDIKILAYANDNIYGRGPVPTGAPVSTLPGGVDFASGTGFPNPSDPSDLTFPNNILFATDISTLPFISAITKFTPFDVVKSEPGIVLIGKEITTTLTIKGNSLGALNNFHLKDVIPKNRKFVGFTQTGGVSGITVLYNTPTNGEVTLDMSGISVPINTELDITYKTLALAYEISSYTGSTILLNTGSIITDRTSSMNTVTMLTEGTWFDGSSNVFVNGTTVIGPKSSTTLLAFASLSKGVDIPNPVIGDTLTYTVNVKTARNTSFTTNGSGTYIIDTLPDGMIFSGAISSTASGTGTALTFISSTPDASGNGDTILLWKLNAGIINADETITIVYQTYVDGLFEGAGDTTYENTDTLDNKANFFGTIGDSGNDEEWGITDPSVIGTNLSYISGGNGTTISVSAPLPINDKRVLSVTTPDGTVYTSGGIPSKVPVGSALEFLITMDFPNVHFINTKIVDALPLLTGPNNLAYDFAFQTNTSQLDIDGNSVLYNTNDKTSGTSDNSFNGLTLSSTGWISETPANNIEFDLGSGIGGKVFAIKFKVDILPNIPSPIPSNGLVPLTNLSISSFENDSGTPNNLEITEFPFTISLPFLTLNKTSSGTNISAGKNIDYRLEIENTGNANAFIENIVDTLPSNLDLQSFNITYSSGGIVPNSSVTQSGTTLNIIFNTGAISPNRSVISENTIIYVDYTVKANTGFVIKSGDSRVNNVSLDYYSSSGSTSEEIYNFGPITDTASFISDGPSITRTLISTSEADTSGNDLLIGEEATFETIITLPGGTYNSSSFLDIIDNTYLDFVTGSLVSVSGSLTLGNPAGVFSMVNNELKIDFGNIINNDTDILTSETIVIHTTERTKNGAGNNKKTKSRFRSNLLNKDSGNVSVDLFEPNLSISKVANPTTGDAGDIIGYTVTVTNLNTIAPAYDLALTDIFLSKITYVTGSLNVGSFSGTETDFLSGSGLTFAKLLNGAPQTITFSGILDNDVLPNDAYTNTAYVGYNSLDDDISTYENTYSKNNGAIVIIYNTTITHELYNTDLADTGSGKYNTSLEDLAIGEIAYYRTIITIPETSFSGFTFVQDLPAGLKFLSGNIGADTITHSLSNISITPDNKITFDLGDVNNIGGGVKTIELLTQAVVLDNGANNAGNTKISTATVNYGTNSSFITTGLEVVEPNVNITKVYSPNVGDGGDSILTTIIINNSGTAPAYDLLWSDILPPKTTSGAGFVASSGSTILNPGQSISYTYNTILDNTVTSGEVLTGTASINYSSYPLTPANGERDYSDNDTDNISIVVISGLSFMLNTTSNVKIGDVSNYTIRVPIAEGITNNLLITDIIPAGISVVSGSINIAYSGALSYSGFVQSINPLETSIITGQSQILTWTFTGIVNSDSNNIVDEFITITYDAVNFNSSDNNNGDTKIHNVTANYNSGGVIKNADSAPIAIIEPNVSIVATNNYSFGNDFEYLFTVTNNGTATAYDLDLTSIVPAGVTFSGGLVITNSGTSVNLVKVGNNFTIDSLPVNTGNPLTFKIAGTLDSSITIGTVLTLTENIIYTSQSGNYSAVIGNALNIERNGAGGINDYSDSDNTPLTVSRAFLDESIAVVDLNLGNALRGEVFEYTITLINSGSENLNNIPVTLDIPSNFTGFAIQGTPAGSTDNSTSTGGVNNAGQVNISGIYIPVGQSRTIVYRVRSKDNVIDGTVIPSVANVGNSDERAIGGSPSIPITIIVAKLKTTSIEIDDNGGSLYQNEIITHNETIQNTGSSTGTNMQVTLTYSSGTTFQSGSLVFMSGSKINSGSIVINDLLKTITFTITEIAPGITESFTFKTKATGNVGDTITTNIGAVIDENENSNSVSNTLVIVSSYSGGGGSRHKDNCPDGDYTRSNYDRACGIKPIEKPLLVPPYQGVKEIPEADKKEEIKEDKKTINKEDKENKENKIKEGKEEKIILDNSSLNKDYEEYLLKKSELDFIINNERVSGNGLKILPRILPQTGTPISKRISKTGDRRVKLDLPSNVGDLAGNYIDDIEFWKKGVVEEDRNRDEYIVIPSNGLVVSVNNVPEDTTDFTKMISGKEIKINNYLKTGVMAYPGSSTNDYGEVGNKVVFGHSSYWKKDNGRYKTHFQKIIELDNGEEVWVYKRVNGEFKRFRYLVEKSYNTDADDTSVLKPGIGSNLTLFTCTPIGGIKGRWIIKAKFIDEDKKDLQAYIYGTKILFKYRIAINRFVNKFSKIDESKRKIIILEVYSRLVNLEKSKTNKSVLEIIRYMKMKLAIEYNR